MSVEHSSAFCDHCGRELDSDDGVYCENCAHVGDPDVHAPLGDSWSLLVDAASRLLHAVAPTAAAHTALSLEVRKHWNHCNDMLKGRNQ